MPIFDSHLHIIDPRFPLIANQGYLPDAFDCAAYRMRTAQLGIQGGTVVSGSFQAFDQSYLRAALEQLGPGFVGVSQVPADVSDGEILELDRVGVRAVRFNLRRGGSAEIRDLDRLARRVHEVAGWHTELYVDARELAAIRQQILALPAVSIDHLGLSFGGLDELCRLVEQGVHVKATGFGRLDFEAEVALERLHRVNPEALMFGSDLPSTRAPKPFNDNDVQRVIDCLGETEARRVLWQNAARFYRLQQKEG